MRILPGLVSSLLALGTLSVLSAPAQAADTDVQINEVEASGGVPGDWVELINTGAAGVDIGGWVVKDETDGVGQAIPGGVTLAGGARYVVDTSGLGGGADSARLFDGVTLIDSFSWTSEAGGTWSACPEGGATFADRSSTKGAANDCAAASPWPGGTAVAEADAAGTFGSNLSGLVYDASDVWAVKNNPSTLYRLTATGQSFSASQTYPLTFPGGAGNPDAEGVTVTDAGAAGGVYVAVERNDVPGSDGTSRPAVLRFAPTGVGGQLVATDEWDLTVDLPGLAPNAGLEAISWVPDSYLTASGFRTGAGTAYSPAAYTGHGTGLFFVGVEQTGEVIAYALDATTDTATRVATITSGFPAVMELNWEPATEKLWVVCDNTCNGRVKTFEVSTTAGPAQGTFEASATYERPSGMPNLNNEGFAIAPSSQCSSGSKTVLWADDGNTGGHALRRGTIDCTALPAPECSSQEAAVTQAQAGVATAQTAYGAATSAVSVAQTAATQAAQAAQAASTAKAAADAKLAKAKKKLKAAKKSGNAAKIANAKKKVKAAKKAQSAAVASLSSAAFAAAGTSKALGSAQATQTSAGSTLASAQAALAAAQASLAGCRQR